MTSERAAHRYNLVGAAWVHLETLHPAAETEKAGLGIETMGPEAAAREGARTQVWEWEAPLDYGYVMAMWTRGLRHSNPAVRQATKLLIPKPKSLKSKPYILNPKP